MALRSVFDDGFLPFPVSSDFGTKSSILQFKECETSRCMNITIKDDGVVENDEVFGVKLTKSPLLSRIRLEPVDGMITVKDNDCKYGTCM